MEINIREQLEQIRDEAKKNLSEIRSSEELENFRVRVLGKKGELTSVLSQMGKLSSDMRPVIGQKANEVRAFIEEQIKTAKEKTRRDSSRQSCPHGQETPLLDRSGRGQGRLHLYGLHNSERTGSRI